MKSPFPGMDPYLERHWRDVHQALITYTRDALNAQLPESLTARVEERVSVEGPTDQVRLFIPDVHVREDRGSEGGAAAVGAAVAEPITVEINYEPAVEGYVQVIDQDGRVISVIEFLSPSNKRGEGLRDYLGKRSALLEGGVNMIEIDLVRQGDWRALVEQRLSDPRLRAAYRAMIRRAGDRRKIDFFPIQLSARLPILPIPLRESDPDARLDLQSLIEQAYENGRYARTDYRQPCEPPLEGEEAAWAEQLLTRQGRR